VLLGEKIKEKKKKKKRKSYEVKARENLGEKYFLGGKIQKRNCDRYGIPLRIL
jgi:hypothetical protein